LWNTTDWHGNRAAAEPQNAGYHEDCLVPGTRRTQAAWLLSTPQYPLHHLWCTMCANRFPDVLSAFL